MAHLEDRWVRKDKTHTPLYGKGLRWRVIYEDGGRRTKSFKNKEAAKDFLVSVDHRQRSGEYVPATRRKALVSDLLPAWEASLIRLKPSTRGEVAIAVRSTILPKWANYQVGAVTRQDVQQWVNEMHADGKAGRTVDTLYGRLRAFYAWCVVEGHVPVSPCHNITLPRGVSREHVYLSPAQVLRLLDCMDPRYRLLTEMLVTTGLRFGEAAELRGRDLDLPRRRANVNRAVTRAKVDTPKTHRRRAVPLTADVTAQLEDLGPGRDELVFKSSRGGQLQANNFKARYFDPAAEAAGMPEGLTVRDLRHTSASLAVASGANVKAVQRMLGHASAAMTLDTYAGLFSDDLDDVAVRMGELLRPPGTPTEHPAGQRD